MKIYIAARRQEAARELAERLKGNGHTIVSSWIWSANYALEKEYVDDELIAIAIQDEREVRQADCLILIAEPLGEMVPGGKHVETGMAIALGIPVVVMGRRENIFHWHPRVAFVANEESVLSSLKDLDFLRLSAATNVK